MTIVWMIIHTVQFAFKDEVSEGERGIFFREALKLTSIPGTEDFEVFRQMSVKNPYEFCFSMKFENQERYDFYSNHDLHNDFVKNQWMTRVGLFQEADFEVFDPSV